MSDVELAGNVVGRIQDHMTRNGGIQPDRIVVDTLEYKAVMNVLYALSDLPGAPAHPAAKRLLRLMGVPVEIGPVTYPWGTFPE